MTVRGHLDRIDRILVGTEMRHRVAGWARDDEAPRRRPVIEIMIDDAVAHTMVGDDHRGDLAEAGMEDGTYGFHYIVAHSYDDARPHLVRIRVRETGAYLVGESEFRSDAPMPTDRFTADPRVWQGRSNELAAGADLDAGTWLGAIQRAVRQSPTAAPFAVDGWEKAAPVLSVCALLMVKNEEDIIPDNLGWLYCLGVRRFVVLENNSDDRTGELIRRFRARFADVELLTVHDPIVRYVQSQKMTGIMRLAGAVWPDCRWVLPVDADEFLVAAHGLAALDGVPDDVDAIIIAKCYHFISRPCSEAGLFEPDVFRRMALRAEKHRAPPKILCRIRDEFALAGGNHFLLERPGGRPAVYASPPGCDFYFREFSIRSYAQFKSKVLHGGIAIEAANQAGVEVGGSHWLSRFQGFRAKGDAWLREVYERDYVFDEGGGLVADVFPVAELVRRAVG